MKELEAAVGGLSKPSKMPGLSYGTPAAECKVGSILRAAGKHTVCGSCYAHKGAYTWGPVRTAQARRLEILSSNLPQWQADMTELLRRKYAKKAGDAAVFRWHDSGDLQSREHLAAIVAIARELPGIRFWLPTKEYRLVREFVSSEEIPSNLVVRVSAPTLGAIPAPIPGTVSSTVDADHGRQCPAYDQGGECGDCRACWDPAVASVNYPRH